ncbi:MAG: hypothetical protein JF617_14545 [Burkholderiales bacterium]|nr:hypothetical protein [Burkholderiales bacterium]
MRTFTDRREWEGRAVNIGEAIMQIADPRAVELRIDLPAREQRATPQIGSRGTARVNGRWAPLIYSVLKRPISSLRQKIGL